MITKLVDIPSLFGMVMPTSWEPVTAGQTWYRPQRAAWSGDPVLIDQVAISAGYNPSGPNSVMLVLVGQDRFGDVGGANIVASYTTAMTVNGTEVADKGVAVFRQPSSSAYDMISGAFWAQSSAGQPAGTFDIKFAPFRFVPGNVASDVNPYSAIVTGAPTTLISNIANFNSLDWDYTTGANPVLLVGYSTRAAGSNTQNTYYQAFSETGQALWAPVQVSSGARANSAFGVVTDGTNFFTYYETITSGVASLTVKSLTASSGALGSAVNIATNFATLMSTSVYAQGDGSYDIVAEGLTAGGQHYLNIYQATGAFVAGAPSATIALTNPGAIRYNAQRLSGGELVVAYTDANQVHLALFNAAGSLVEDYVVPGLTNFDRVRSLGQGQFELMWRETVSGNENVAKAAIFDIANTGRTVDSSGATSGQWILGSHLADTITTGSANDIVKGYGGNDVINGGAGRDEVEFTGNRSDYTLTKNGDGSWTVSDSRAGSPDGTDTLRNVELVDFADGKKQLIQAQAVELQRSGPIFTDPDPGAGEVWSRTHRAQVNGDPVWISTYSPAAGYVAGGPNPQTLVLAPQDRFGDIGASVEIATYMSAKSVNNAEVFDRSIFFYQQSGSTAQGIVVWTQPSSGQPAGTFDIKFQKFSYSPANLAGNTGQPAISLVGSIGTVFANVQNYQFFDWNSTNGLFALGYSTRVAGGTTQDFWYQSFDPVTGGPAGPLTKVATLSASATGVMSLGANNSTFLFFGEDNTNPNVALLGMTFFNPITGATASVGQFATDGLSDIISIGDVTVSTGEHVVVVEGTQAGTGKHVLQIIGLSSQEFRTQAATTIELDAPANLGRLQVQALPNGLVVVGYADNGQVHLTLADPFGNIVSDTIVPGLTNFDRLRSLGQNQFELAWRETVSGNENVVKTAIYSANEGARIAGQPNSSSAQWLVGTQFDDIFFGGSGNDIFKGYAGDDDIDGGAGNDEVDFTGVRANYSIVQNADGSLTVTDLRGGSPDGTDTLRNVETLQFADQLTLASGATASSFSIAATSADMAEGTGGTTSFTFTVTRGGETSGVGSVSWSLALTSAVDSADFPGGTQPAGILNFAAGETSKTITINVAGDAVAERDEALLVSLSGATGGSIANGQALGVIRNDDGAVSLDTSPIKLLQNLGPLFSNGSGPIDGQNWGRAHRAAFNGDPLVISAYTPAGSYVSGGPNSQAIVVTGQDRFGDTEKFAITVATYTSAKNVLNSEVLDRGLFLFNQPNPANYVVNGGAFWAQATVGGPAGSFDIKFQALTFTPPNVANDAKVGSVVLVGAQKTLLSGVANYNYVDWDYSGSNVVLMATTQAVGSSTKDLHVVVADTAGNVTRAPAKIATLSTGAAATIAASGSSFIVMTENEAGALRSLEFQNFSPTAGLTGAVTSLQTTMSDITRLTPIALSDGSWIVVTEGTEAGAHVFKTYHTSLAGVLLETPGTIALGAGNLSRVAIQRISDDHVLLGYTDNGQVHLVLINSDGGIESDYVVPGITNFDHIRSLGQNQFEIMWRETVSGNENVVKGAIYETNIGARNVDATASNNSQWLLGSSFDDTLTGGSGNDSFKGYDGNDAINGLGGVNEAKYTGARADYTVTNNGNGSWTVTDNRVDSPDGTDTLRNVQVLDFADGVLALGLSASNDTGSTVDGKASGSVLTNDTATTGGGLAVASVKGLTTNVGVAVTGTYGTLLLKADGTYTYSFTATGAATGSHLIDSFAYTAIEGRIGSIFGSAVAQKGAVLDITINRAPVITAASITPAHGAASVSGATLAAAADPDGDTIVKYEFYDATSDVASGTMVLNGVDKAPGAAFEVLASDLANTSLRLGSVSDTLYVRAFDGVDWSAWKTVTVAAPPNRVPVVTPTSVSFTPAHGATSINGNSLFSFSDADGDTAVRYEVYDASTGASSGFWKLAGVAQAAGTSISVTNLADLTWSPGTTSDTVYVRAFDGYAWSAAAAITLNPPPNMAPVVTPTSASFTPTRAMSSVAANLLFSSTDADGDTIQRYEVYDANTAAGSGFWTLGGVAQAAGTLITVTNLADLSWSSGSAADTVYVRALDGNAWGASASFVINAPANALPVVTAANFLPTHSQQSVAVASFFSVADGDSDTITKYQFYDATSDSASGVLKLNGVAQTALSTIEVAAANLGTTTWAYGAVSDVLYVRAFDGLAWGDWKSFTAPPPPNVAPVVTPTSASFTPAHGTTSVAASVLFSVSDADSDTIQRYEVYDANGNAGSGVWKLAGVTQASGTLISVTNLADLTWSPGTTSDTVYVRAFDGYAWSAAVAITLNPAPNVAPVVTPTSASFTPAHGTTSVAASVLFSVNDADSDTIQRYEVYDANGSAGSGVWKLAGVTQASGTLISVTNLADLTWSPGTTSDTVYVRAFDGTSWGAAATITLNPAPNVAPVVTPTSASFTPAHGTTSVAASALFSVSDADSDTIQRYEVYDANGNAGSGVWKLAGVTQASGTLISVTNLADLTWSPGTTSDTVYVRAFDGTSWGAAATITLNPAPNVAPVVTPTSASFTPAHGTTSVAASALFSVSDADSDTIQRYEVYDANGNAGSGVWKLAGVTQASGTLISVTNLADLTWSPGTTSDTVYVRAFDGTSWSAAAAITLNPAPNVAPTISSGNITATHGQSVAGASFLSATDPDGDTITAYQIYDATAGEASGSVKIGGVAQAALTTIDVSAAQLASTAFETGSGADELYVRAFDGISWGAWKSLAITAPIDAAPVVTAGTTTAAAGASVSFAQLFNVTDAESDAITAYQVYDANGGANSGHFAVGGSAKPAGQLIDVLAADLAQAAFVAGSSAGTDTIYIRAFDGYVWSEAKMINFATT